MITIEVYKRAIDWACNIEGHEGKWAAGGSPGHAIGNLVMAHKEEFPCIKVVSKKYEIRSNY